MFEKCSQFNCGLRNKRIGTEVLFPFKWNKLNLFRILAKLKRKSASKVLRPWDDILI